MNLLCYMGKWELKLQMELGLIIRWRWHGRLFGFFFMWTQCNHKVLFRWKRKARKSVSEWCSMRNTWLAIAKEFELSLEVGKERSKFSPNEQIKKYNPADTFLAQWDPFQTSDYRKIIIIINLWCCKLPSFWYFIKAVIRNKYIT